MAEVTGVYAMTGFSDACGGRGNPFTAVNRGDGQRATRLVVWRSDRRSKRRDPDAAPCPALQLARRFHDLCCLQAAASVLISVRLGKL